MSMWWLIGAMGLAAFADPGQGPTESTGYPVQTLSPLERLGHDLYLREACAGCHAKPHMGAPGQGEAPADAMGPDLHLIGGMYPDGWHYAHLKDPRSTTPGSTMPGYPHLLTAKVQGVVGEARTQADAIVGRLSENGFAASADDAVVAMIAFLQRVGREERAALWAETQAKRAAEAEAALEAFQRALDERDPELLEAGRQIYETHCSACHADDLTGGIAPSLVDQEWTHGGGFAQILQVTAEGVAAKGMPGFGAMLGDEKVRQVAAYVHMSTRVDAAETVGAEPAMDAVDRERLEALGAGIEGADPATLASGEALYAQHCAACHRPDMTGLIGPNLVDKKWLHGGKLEQIEAVIGQGVVEKGMVAWGPVLGDEKVRQVSLYVYARSREKKR